MSEGDLTYIDADGKPRGYCGFNEVRRRHDGEYYCSFCGRELGADFGEIVRLSLPPQYSKRLAAQCGHSTAETVTPDSGPAVHCPDCTDPDCEKGCAYADDDES